MQARTLVATGSLAAGEELLRFDMAGAISRDESDQSQTYVANCDSEC